MFGRINQHSKKWHLLVNKKLLKLMIYFIKLLLYPVQNHYQIIINLNVIKKVF